MQSSQTMVCLPQDLILQFQDSTGHDHMSGKHELVLPFFIVFSCQHSESHCTLQKGKSDGKGKPENTCCPDLQSGLLCIPTFMHVQMFPQPNEDLLPVFTVRHFFPTICLFFFSQAKDFSLLHPQVLLTFNFTNFKSLQKLFLKSASVK